MAKPRVIKTPRMRPRNATPELPIDQAVVRLVRFMDDYFGAGNWEQRDGEPLENIIIRQVARDAFFAGAGIDRD